MSRLTSVPQFHFSHILAIALRLRSRELLKHVISVAKDWMAISTEALRYKSEPLGRCLFCVEVQPLW